MLKRTLQVFVVIIFLLILLITIPLTYIYFSMDGDIAPVHYSDLSLQKITINKEDNAFYDLDKNVALFEKSRSADKGLTEDAKSLSDQIGEHLSKKKWDEEVVAKLLSENSEAMANFYNAAAKLRYQQPELEEPDKIEKLMEMPVPSLLMYRHYARLSALQA